MGMNTRFSTRLIYRLNDILINPVIFFGADVRVTHFDTPLNRIRTHTHTHTYAHMTKPYDGCLN